MPEFCKLVGEVAITTIAMMASARGLRILDWRSDEPDAGHCRLRLYLEGVEAAAELPGKPGAYTALYQCTDAALLAKAIEWMATGPRCANQAFSITNGDLIRWQHLWPKFADFFDMEMAQPRHISLPSMMADKGPVWDRIVAEHGLQHHRFENIAAWGYPEGVFNSHYDIVSDTSKARRFGFHELVGTEEMFLRMFANFRQKRLIPRATHGKRSQRRVAKKVPRR